jgi:hypothetical protein
VNGRVVHCEHHASARKFRDALIEIAHNGWPLEMRNIALAALSDEIGVKP